MVNSAHSGFPSKVTSIEQALHLLGMDAIKNIAISTAVFQVFGEAKDHGVFKLKLFWRHSLLCATLAELIAKKTSCSSPDEAFLSGLLHDIGKLVLCVNFPDEYSDILQSSNNKSELLLAGEMSLGATHCEVGAWMISRWHLQSFMADAVLYHHEPVHRILDALPLVKIVFVANALSTDTVEEDDAKLRTAQEVFGFARSDAKGLILEAEQEVHQIAQSLDIEIEPPELLYVSVSDTNHEKEQNLVRGVRDISLLQATLQNLLEAYGQEAILNVIQQGLQVLFDVNRALFLLLDPEKEALVGKGGLEPSQDTLIKELVISLQAKKSLIVQSLQQGIPLDSFGHQKKADLSIIDTQVIRLIGKSGILCLPMIAHKQNVGMIILGLEQAQVSHLSNQMNLLTMFANRSALAVHADSVRQTQSKLVQSERWQRHRPWPGK